MFSYIKCLSALSGVVLLWQEGQNNTTPDTFLCLSGVTGEKTENAMCAESANDAG